MLSVVIPAFNEEQMIGRTGRVISDLLQKAEIDYELLFVNDGSTDGTWAEIRRQSASGGNVRGISFSRNFGKEAALFAGLAECRGDCAVTIDCDLQHPPEKIIEMYRLWESGYEVVEGVKRSRGRESGWHALAAKAFYRLISDATRMDMSHASDFKLLDRKAIEALMRMPERNAFFRALSSWIGFKSAQVYYDVQDREAGESKWSTGALIRYAMTNIASFTTLPMQVVTVLGLVMLAMSAVLTVQTLYKKLVGAAVEGFTTVIILQCFTGSVMMISLGIIGYYLARMYEELKGRPRYIIAERTEDGRDLQR